MEASLLGPQIYLLGSSLSDDDEPTWKAQIERERGRVVREELEFVVFFRMGRGLIVSIMFVIVIMIMIELC